MKFGLIVIFLLASLGFSVYADTVLDVEVYENYISNSRVYSLSNMSPYSYQNLEGYIKITNKNKDESLHDIYLEIENDHVINSIKHFSGSIGYISKRQPDINMTIFIPDLGPNDFSIFRYVVKREHVFSVINYNSKYDDTKILAGLPIKLSEFISPLYNDSGCVSNLRLVLKSKTLTLENGSQYPFFINPDPYSKNEYEIEDYNSSLIYEPKEKCIQNKSYEISYYVKTPSIDARGNFEFLNGSLSYEYNDTLSSLSIKNYNATVNLRLEFSKIYDDPIDENGSVPWQIISQVSNPTDFIVNLTKVSLWVAKQGPEILPSDMDSDFYADRLLEKKYDPRTLLDPDSPFWDNSNDKWQFNYSASSSPIVWMDIDNILADIYDQVSKREFTQTANSVFVKEIYITTGYWLEVKKNIIKLRENNYLVEISVKNLGNQPTPSNEPVVVYNFIPIGFNLTSSFSFSSSDWYQTANASQKIQDEIFNGTMHKFAIIPTNHLNASLDKFDELKDEKDTWQVSYEIEGTSEFNFNDLFITGASPTQIRHGMGAEIVEVETQTFFAKDTLGFILGYMVVVGLIAAYFF